MLAAGELREQVAAQLDHLLASPELDARGPRSTLWIAANYRNGQRTPARNRFWSQLTDRYLARQQSVTRDGRAALLTAGVPGAGKSDAVATLGLVDDGWRRLDSDIVKDYLIEDLAATAARALPVLTLTVYDSTGPATVTETSRRHSGVLQPSSARSEGPSPRGGPWPRYSTELQAAVQPELLGEPRQVGRVGLVLDHRRPEGAQPPCMRCGPSRLFVVDMRGERREGVPVQAAIRARLTDRLDAALLGLQQGHRPVQVAGCGVEVRRGGRGGSERRRR